jgi:importin subunit beta-1
LEAKLAPYCDEIMTILLANLQNPEVERIVKPHIIACLGDIALAVGGWFDRYLPYVMNMLIQASQLKFELVSLDDFEYLQRLRESILEAYTGILQGLGGDNKAEMMIEYLENIIPFLDLVSKDVDRLDEVTRSAVGVIG